MTHERPNIVSRAVRKVAQQRPAAKRDIFDPWSEYRGTMRPEDVPQDSVTVRELTPREARHYQPSDEAREGARVEAAVRQQIAGRRWLDAHRHEFEGRS